MSDTAAPQFQHPGSLVLFVGRGRSGTSILGALIDAHPNAVVSHEYSVLDRWRREWTTREELVHALVERSRKDAAVGNRSAHTTAAYSYRVENQWQGRVERLDVIGDKKAGATTTRLQGGAQPLQELRQALGLPIKLIHVLRNPFDQIMTETRRQRTRGRKKRNPNFTLEHAIEHYFESCAVIANLEVEISNEPSIELFRVRHEDFVADPKRVLTDLCDYLGLVPSGDYLSDCAAIVYESPHQSRHKPIYDQRWTRQLKQRVYDRKAGYSFLDYYSFGENRESLYTRTVVQAHRIANPIRGAIATNWTRREPG